LVTSRIVAQLSPALVFYLSRGDNVGRAFYALIGQLACVCVSSVLGVQVKRTRWVVVLLSSSVEFVRRLNNIRSKRSRIMQ